jgi:hypothetical protein
MANIFFDVGQQNNNSRNDRPKLILLEGTDDAYFIDLLLEMANASPSEVGIVTVGGKGGFENQIKNLKKSTPFTKGKIKGIAIIRDADESFDRSCDETSKTLERQFGVKLRHGEIKIYNDLLFGFFILPGGNMDGDLERLCLSTVEDSSLFSRSQQYLMDSNIAANDQFFKRQAQVYLAGMPNELCRGAGLGFKKEMFDKMHPALNALKDFLSSFDAGQVI